MFEEGDEGAITTLSVRSRSAELSGTSAERTGNAYWGIALNKTAGKSLSLDRALLLLLTSSPDIVEAFRHDLRRQGLSIAVINAFSTLHTFPPAKLAILTCGKCQEVEIVQREDSNDRIHFCRTDSSVVFAQHFPETFRLKSSVQISKRKAKFAHVAPAPNEIILTASPSDLERSLVDYTHLVDEHWTQATVAKPKMFKAEDFRIALTDRLHEHRAVTVSDLANIRRSLHHCFFRNGGTIAPELTKIGVEAVTPVGTVLDKFTVETCIFVLCKDVKELNKKPLTEEMRQLWIALRDLWLTSMLEEGGGGRADDRQTS